MLFRAPSLDPDDLRVIEEINQLRRELRIYLHEPRRWKGQMRRNLKARAVRGSNSIEGYDVSLDDALAIMEDEEPLDADRRTSLEIVGYRNALTYIQQLADDAAFSLDESLIRSLHFMMLGHDLSKSPGRYRPGQIFVHDEERNVKVYEGPDADDVPALMQELVASLTTWDDECPVFVRAAMAHLNLVMIHPFRDGNGRMARALQTMVLAREKILSPEFSSIEEWLGRNTQSYYSVLAEVGSGEWHPERDAKGWVRFNLVAHHMQAQTVLRRVDDASRTWAELEKVVVQRRLPERAVFALYSATLGLKVRRPVYEKDADIEVGTANRDLRFMVSAGLLEAQGETRGRYYLGTPELREIRRSVIRERPRTHNPYEQRTNTARRA
ncbi:Fic family protein [Actinoplanes sp. ATCC 53533]|uniref:Fic family protein n=1 Tax=Actinoplanes sp. ATCC 53533 TaxID=1288362 RepID=UPI000F78EE2D|nr:Fic family protein [Actinoplanes sp. ATCC 53533]RSM60254.1 Fic family protein [Actinoplanes sp. ATCC 53533]